VRVQGQRQDGSELRLGAVGVGGAVELIDGPGPTGIEPGNDRGVVGGGVREGGAGKPAPGGGRESTGPMQLLQDDG